MREKHTQETKNAYKLYEHFSIKTATYQQNLGFQNPVTIREPNVSGQNCWLTSLLFWVGSLMSRIDMPEKKDPNLSAKWENKWVIRKEARTPPLHLFIRVVVPEAEN